jgi:hypothetical protein
LVVDGHGHVLRGPGGVIGGGNQQCEEGRLCSRRSGPALRRPPSHVSHLATRAPDGLQAAAPRDSPQSTHAALHRLAAPLAVLSMALAKHLGARTAMAYLGAARGRGELSGGGFTPSAAGLPGPRRASPTTFHLDLARVGVRRLAQVRDDAVLKPPIQQSRRVLLLLKGPVGVNGGGNQQCE